MTEERSVLAELMEKAGNGDFLGAVAETVLRLLMESDVEGLSRLGHAGVRSWCGGCGVCGSAYHSFPCAPETRTNHDCLRKNSSRVCVWATPATPATPAG